MQETQPDPKDIINDNLTLARKQYQTENRRLARLKEEGKVTLDDARSFVTARSRYENATAVFMRDISKSDLMTPEQFETVNAAIGADEKVWNLAVAAMAFGDYSKAIAAVSADLDFRSKQAGEYMMRILTENYGEDMGKSDYETGLQYVRIDINALTGALQALQEQENARVEK